MELSFFTSFPPRSPRLASPNPTILLRRFSYLRVASSELRRRISVSSAKDSVFTGGSDEAEKAASSTDFWTDSEIVEVIAIGSRKDAVLSFCVDSPFRSPSLRYWSVVSKDSMKVQLQQKIVGKDPNPSNFEIPTLSVTSSKTIILVASAGYGADHVSTINILKAIRSANGFAVAIILKPFSFEGQRRQDEIKDLKTELQEHTNLFIDLDTDKLLKKDLVTLDEAVKTTNNAVLLAVAAVSVLKYGMYRKVIGASVKKIQVSEVVRTLKRFKEAKIGFGAGFNLKASILQSIYDCPFLSTGVKDLDGTILCIIACSDVITEADIDAFEKTFRESTEYTKELLLSTIHEPNLEPNLIVTTVVVLGTNFTGPLASQGSGILTRLARRFPFFLNFLKSDSLQPSISEKKDFPEESQNLTSVEGAVKFAEKIQKPVNYKNDRSSSESDNEFGDAVTESSTSQDSITEGASGFQREELVGATYQIAREWAKEREAETVDNKLSIFPLPVGVRPSQELTRFNVSSSPTQKSKDAVKLKPSTGILSVRAASMLEAERDSPKSWSPVVELKYRGGVYRGRCQGGLPEGKGRLVVGDGSIYDGMWRYGKKSGSGTLYFSNGDVFQGSWRDDVMHGKGWFYFHSGDRWFANFWKGKANGEGRFYSKSGDVLFGHFQDGWRHGDFVCIDVDGRRCIEKWDHGVLVSRNSLET